MRGVRSFAFIVLTAMFLACGGDGDDGGLTAPPPPVPQIAGHWVGDWLVNGELFGVVEMSINQSGSNLTGTFDLIGDPLEITGTVSPTLMRWEVPGFSCGSITGNSALENQAPTTMSGTIDWNFILCTSPERYSGTVTWRRTGTQAKQAYPHGRPDPRQPRRVGPAGLKKL